uniref:Isopentenyl phosphate kinase n=1 Tax=Archaeoglobus fulgidus TaxID=2234 RepID=A0A7J2TJJ2_ARCFL
MKILKIGGSVITKKDGFEELNEAAVEEICSAISENYSNLILIHGAGSFGHPHVRIFGLETPISIARIHDSCVRLNLAFCRKLLDKNVPAVGLHPMSCDFEKIGKLLEKGFVPVLHGDVSLDGIISGDSIAVRLAEAFGAERVGFATNVDGIFVNGRVVEKFYPWMKPDMLGDDDATGKMRGKLERIFSMKKKCRVFVFRGNGENVKKFLEGKEVGTEVIL